MISLGLSKNNKFRWLTVKETGNLISTTETKLKPKGGVIRKLNKDTYVDTRTGVICKFKHTTTRMDDIKSIKSSMSNLRDLVNTNVTNAENCLWVTLTYKENMTDNKRLYKDFDKFNKKMHYHYGNFEYIACAEPQERGAWHMHVIMIFDKKTFIPNKDLANLWEHGFTKTTNIDNVDNVGAYLSAYLSDLEIDIVNTDNTNSKKILKGARLVLYPRGMHFYRTSKGIKKPTKYRTTFAEFCKRFINTKIIQPHHLTFTKTKTYESDNYSNTITWNVFNLKKKPTPTDNLPLDIYGAIQEYDIFF